MKLSQLTTDQATNVLCELTPYIANITGDKTLSDTLSEKIGSGKSAAEIFVYGAKKAASIVPIILKDHKTDVFGILSVLNNKTEEDIAKQNIITTMKQIQEIWQDNDLVDFFKSWREPEKTE